MNIYKWMVLAALALAVALPFTRQVVAGEFADTLDTPALHSNLAVQGPLTGLASAGERLVVVGQRGHILYSDDAGRRWQQAEVPVSSDLVAVHFPSASQGWAVGHDGVVRERPLEPLDDDGLGGLVSDRHEVAGLLPLGAAGVGSGQSVVEDPDRMGGGVAGDRERLGGLQPVSHAGARS